MTRSAGDRVAGDRIAGDGVAGIETRVGIEKIGVYPCALALPMEALCEARGVAPRHVREELLIDQRSLNPVWEDPVTMAVHAAEPMLTETDRATIELLLVCSESGVDQEKPMSTWVHRYLGLSSRCRNLELKHACYSGTAALHLAASWVRAGGAGANGPSSGSVPSGSVPSGSVPLGSVPSNGAGKKALVITTDQSRMHLGQPWEYVMGAGACAFLVSSQPDFLELDPSGASGVYTEEVSDLTRPTSRVETGNSETSLISYLQALESAYDHFVEVSGGLDFDRDFRWHVYHVPFGGLTFRAHRALLRRADIRDADAVRRHYAQRTLPSLAYNRRMGGTYAGSTFIALLGLADAPDARPGDPVSIFSYGSGCCAEFYRARMGARVKEVAAAAALKAALDRRRLVDTAEYEAIERERTSYIDEGDYASRLDLPRGLYDETYAGRRHLVFRGMADYVRQYAWS